MNTKKRYFKCEICGNEFYSKWGKKKTCSNECLNKFKLTDEYKNHINKKRKETFLKKYGVDNPAKLECIKEKIKNTNINRYGFVSPTLNTEVREKQKQTCLRKYGVETPLENKSIMEKTQTTLKMKYGTSTTWKSQEIIDKSLKTKLKKYGDENYNNPKKTKKTKLEKYGNENYFNIEKVKQTNLEKHGVPFVMMSEEIRNKAINTNFQKYGVDNPAKNKSIKKKTEKNNLKKYGKKYPIQNNEIKQKALKSFFKKHYNDIILSNEKYKNIEPLFLESEYIGTLKKYKFQCKICNNIFEDSLSNGHIPLCRECYPSQHKLQNEIVDYIKTFYKEPIVVDDKKTISPLELDVYLPSNKLAIEFNGLYWHSEVHGKKYKNYHINKTKRCLDMGIRLIHIFEDEWIEKQNIVKYRLSHLLYNNSNKKIYARNCEVKNIDYDVASRFLNKYHIQGQDNSKIRIGAFYKNNLVAVMTFGKLRKALGNKITKPDEYEMYRFCISDEQIVGIGGKLLSYFVKNYNPKKIISYADKRWSNNTAFYSKIGFKLTKETSPNYWYIDNNYQHRYYRYNFRKQLLPHILQNYDKNLTEWQNMQNHGFDRIWDCGNLKCEITF